MKVDGDKSILKWSMLYDSIICDVVFLMFIKSIGLFIYVMKFF